MDFSGKVVENLKLFDDYIDIAFQDGTNISCSFHSNYNSLKVTATIFVNDEYKPDIVI